MDRIQHMYIIDLTIKLSAYLDDNQVIIDNSVDVCIIYHRLIKISEGVVLNWMGIVAVR